MQAVVQLLQGSLGTFVALCAILGLVVGSFLNVVIHRLPTMLKNRWRADCQWLESGVAAGNDGTPRYDLSHPASSCPKCAKAIGARDNIPLLSYLLLRGQCRHCGTRISPRYPAVELLSAATSAAVAYQFGFGIEAAVGLALTWTLIALAAIDLDTQYLPDELTLPLLWGALVLAVAVGRGTGAFPVTPGQAIVGAAAGYLSLWTVHHAFRLLTGREGFGYGDFKLLAAVGAFGGWTVLLPTLLISALAGSVVGVTLVVLGRHGRREPIPYGPFLAAAGWLVLVFPQELVARWWPFTP